MLAKLFLLAAIYVFTFHLVSADVRRQVLNSIFHGLAHPEYTAAG